MSNDAWTHVVTGLYMVCNASRLLAYLPQIDGLVRRRRTEGVSVASWLIFAVTHASTAACAFEMNSDRMLVWYRLANLTASLLVASLAARAQWKARRIDTLPVAANHAAMRFYSALHATADRSGQHGDRLGHRVDAPFLDAVARDQRDPIPFQFRPFDLASGIGKRAARMKRAA